MNEGIITFMVILGLIALAWVVDFLDKHKHKLKGVQPRVEVYKPSKNKFKKVS